MFACKYNPLIFTLLLITACTEARFEPAKDAPWSEVSEQLLAFYKDSEFPPHQLSYRQNLEAISGKDDLQRQKKVLTQIQRFLRNLNTESLTPSENLDYLLVAYDIELQIVRNQLALQWLNRPVIAINDKGLYHQYEGKAWYRYYLKKWVDITVEPDVVFSLGEKEIAKVKSHIQKIKQRLQNDSYSFSEYLTKEDKFYTNAEQVMAAFENANNQMTSKMSGYFNLIEQTPDLKIQQGDNEQLAHVPGYYSNDTLYFNFFGTQYKKRQVEWLYLHEAIPGHHYQISLANKLENSALREALGPSYGFIEGWAAYVEDLAIETQSYSDKLSELGKWEWDLVRSVRVPLDVGLNYYGWSDQKAMEYWRSHITGRDDIGRREIARMLRWPAQVITYKYGAVKLLNWLKEAQKSSEFDYKEFHRQILQYGSIPFSVLNVQIK